MAVHKRTPREVGPLATDAASEGTMIYRAAAYSAREPTYIEVRPWGSMDRFTIGT